MLNQFHSGTRASLTGNNEGAVLFGFSPTGLPIIQWPKSCPVPTIPDGARLMGFAVDGESPIIEYPHSASGPLSPPPTALLNSGSSQTIFGIGTRAVSRSLPVGSIQEQLCSLSHQEEGFPNSRSPGHKET